MFLLIAPRYDSVTERTHAIAEAVLKSLISLELSFAYLFSDDATSPGIVSALGESIEVIAYYGHGDEDGRLLTQKRESWCEACAAAISNTTIYAHACRGMLYLSQNFYNFELKCAIGYRSDLFQPTSVHEGFWARFREVHAFVPQQLALGRDWGVFYAEFYELCTSRLHEMVQAIGEFGLIELIAIKQARDDIEIIRNGSPQNS